MRFMILLLLYSISCGSIQRPPDIENCITGDNYTFICRDERLDEPDYNREYSVNYICTNADDYNLMRTWIERNVGK